MQAPAALQICSADDACLLIKPGSQPPVQCQIAGQACRKDDK